MNTRLGRLVDRLILACLLLGVAMLFQGLVRGQVGTGGGTGGEPDGCWNYTCKDLDYYYSCGVMAGVALNLPDCLMCTNGRCDTGRTGDSSDCQNIDLKLIIEVCDVTQTCYCANSPNNVEASGAYTGGFTNMKVQRAYLLDRYRDG